MPVLKLHHKIFVVYSNLGQSILVNSSMAGRICSTKVLAND